jgi:hypothetical protein
MIKIKGRGDVMVQQQVLEGTWEEIARHAEELKGRRVRLTVLTEGDAEKRQGEGPRPNEAMLQAMREAEEIQRGMNPKPVPPGLDAVSLIREARRGAMYGYDPAE